VIDAAAKDWLADLGAARKGVQRAAAEGLGALVRSDAALRAHVVDELASPDGRRRWGAAYALSCAGPVAPEAVPALVETLGSDDGDLRWAAARLLVRAIGEGGAERRLLAALLGSPSPLQRKMALYCLRELGPDPSLEPGAIVTATGDADRDVRLAAIAAAAALASGSAAAALAVARRLDDVDAGVRRAAAAGLGRLAVDEPAVRAALGRAAASDDAALARAAAEALSRLDASPRAPRRPPPPRRPG
jgi:HEAT repeat protein